MRYRDYRYNGDESFNFHVTASVHPHDPDVVVESFAPSKLLGIMPGTMFRIVNAPDAPVISVLEPGRDLTDEEKEVLRSGLTGDIHAEFTSRVKTWRISTDMVDYEKAVETFDSRSEFEAIGDIYRQARKDADELEKQCEAVREDVQSLQKELAGLYATRAGKLLRKGKFFIVVAHDEPYFAEVYTKIRLHEKHKGTWTEEDEALWKKWAAGDEEE